MIIMISMIIIINTDIMQNNSENDSVWFHSWQCKQYWKDYDYN